MSNSKAALHFQLGLPSWKEHFFRRSGSNKAKLMDPGEGRPMPDFPYINWIIRHWRSDDDAKADIMMGKLGARNSWKNFFGPWIRKRPWLADPHFIMEHDNEPSNFGILKTKKGRKALADYSLELMRILWEEHGVRSGLYCLGVGHPEVYHVEELLVPALAKARDYESVWCLHEYGYPTVQDGYINDFEPYHILRYRPIVAELRRLGATDIPDLHITEWGIDRLLVGEVGGWRIVNDNPYWMVPEQVAWYDHMTRDDEYVKGFYLFTSTAEETWKTYEWLESDAEVLADYIREN